MSSLEALLGAIDFDPGRDRLWLVGDLVNRGPRSLDVLRWARGLGDRAVVVLGNHDLHLLYRVAGLSGPRRRDTFDDVLAAADRDELVDWLRRRPLLHVENGHVMVHAALHPAWSVGRARALAQEIEEVLGGPDWKRWLALIHHGAPAWRDDLSVPGRLGASLAYFVRARVLGPSGGIIASFDGPPEEAPASARPWFAMPDRAWADHVAVFGHWSALGFRMGPGYIALDSGCVWGNALTAVRLEDRAVFQVESVEARR